MMANAKRDADEEFERNEYKNKRSFISILCKLQRFILIVGGILLVLWFSVTYWSQNYNNSNQTVLAMRRTAGERYGGMEDFMDQIIKSGRLMDHVMPHHYNITLQLFMAPDFNFTTKGRVNILIECVKKTKVSYYDYSFFLSLSLSTHIYI